MEAHVVDDIASVPLLFGDGLHVYNVIVIELKTLFVGVEFLPFGALEVLALGRQKVCRMFVRVVAADEGCPVGLDENARGGCGVVPDREQFAHVGCTAHVPAIMPCWVGVVERIGSGDVETGAVVTDVAVYITC